jgi:signal transduction histidine kinase
LLERPSWWTAQHTLWVLAGTLLVFCASLTWVVVLRRQVAAQTRLIGEKLQREAALEERTRIARDLHDDLGASLTHISFLSEVARKETVPATLSEHLQDISGSTQQAFQALDEIVWLVSPKNDTLDGLTSYICQFAGNFLAGTPIRCRFDVPASLPDVAVPTEVRNNLFLAAKEALNNACKHAKASEVVVRIRLRKETSTGSGGPGWCYCVSIEDNGCGMADEASVGSHGNGLHNMRERLEKLGGRFLLETVPGRGTRIHLEVPIVGALQETNPVEVFPKNGQAA